MTAVRAAKKNIEKFSTEFSSKVNQSLEFCSKPSKHSIYNERMSVTRKINLSNIRHRISQQDAQSNKISVTRSRPCNDTIQS